VKHAPNFLIVGAQKSGTKSHLHHLNQHPDVFVHDKELHFFDRDDSRLIYDEYHQHFQNVEKEVATGVSTPSYMYLQFAMDNIYQYKPDMKLIVFLREPASRAYSQYIMSNKHEHQNLGSFADSIKSIEHIDLKNIRKNGCWALQRGFYIDQIEYILSLFDRANMLILISEQVLLHPLREYNKAFRFLGLSGMHHRTFRFKANIHMQHYPDAAPNEDNDYLAKLYEPYNERLYRFLGYDIPEWQ